MNSIAIEAHSPAAVMECAALQCPVILGALPKLLGFSAKTAGKGAHRVSTQGSPAEDLQVQFEVLPGPGEAGWLGGDSDVSVVIGGGATGRRALWIFADTFITKYDRNDQSRVLDGIHMPHNTLALVECIEERCTGRPQFFWQRDEAGAIVSFFEPPAEKKDDDELLWPVAGIASRDGNSVLLLATRIKGFMNVVGTSVIVSKDVARVDDPHQWQYTTYDVGSTDLTWFSSVFFADNRGEGDTVYIFGHGKGADGSAPSQNSDTVLARGSLGDLLEHDWERTEYWTAPGVWSAQPEGLKAVGLPSWETTCNWSEALGRWYSFNIPAFTTDIFMHTAAEITGEWNKTKVFSIPYPFTQAPWISYAAKRIPSWSAQTEAGVPWGLPRGCELVFSFISNALADTPTDNIIFEPGSMEFTQRGYWPRFVRVIAKMSPEAPWCSMP
mmetsp:Transcript_120876/g.386966  ORF Transcript_120876/g.386966 Transcript_120876/m.386966 type:complete len:441 (+) Transcript_120876:85-1407(+)|eukprot:CAMPEP_0203894188 /NCGR_PEP_ID=MMETSP0359-20131031/37182_1 /ASSEMBLY_ACC=CAM_ASM_000338 /TAXON_ID=268821 /ORGANISM="Scrippsiella Hangoei, Strain SHTV-5" /LENGTH=440 /DNA_ID=CAMNT_0050816445 /DNA_START=54 /DNA_END=1376 /DNA_ORIENTATION=-